jgi:outer membrane protein OmpA-like peptidoglycan-associated protein
MTPISRPLLLGGAAALALAGCVETAAYGTNRTQQGAAIGAAAGAIAGATQGDDTNDRVQNAAVGAIVGGALGAGTGSLLDRQAAELRSSFNNRQIQVVNTGSELVVRMPQDILFAVDSSAVSGTAQGDLGILADNLGRNPRSSVQVIGHTDNTGSAAYNQALSEQRAGAVTSVLMRNGVPASRLRTIGRGEDQPIASNLTPEGRSQNRRVDIVIVPF